MNVLDKIYRNSRKLNGIEPITAEIIESKYVYILDYKANKKIVYFVDDEREAVEVLCGMYRNELYNPNGRNMLSILRSVNIHGFNIEEIANIYGECMRISNGDITRRHIDKFRSIELKI